MKRILLIAVLSVGAYNTMAQLTSCAQTLRLARSTYEQGRLHEIPTLLEKCIASGFSQQEKVEAYKLLCLSYIYLEEPEKADQAMLNLLRTDHYFEINTTDPAEFIALYKTFRTHPIYRFGAKVGANASQPNVKSYLPANDEKGKYLFGVSFQAGFTGEFPITPRLTLSPELNFQLKNFKYENTLLQTDLINNKELHYNVTATEKNAWVSLPVSVQYELFPNSKFHPFIAAGLSADYLLSASDVFQRSKEDRSSYDEQNEDVLIQRNRLNVSAIASAGTKVKVPNGYAIAEIRFQYGLTQVTNETALYDLPGKSIPTDGYVDGLFSLNTVSFTLGYVYNVFNPKKLKR